MKLKANTIVYISLFLFFVVATVKSTPVRNVAYASETNWDDYYAKKEAEESQEPTIFESAWEDSVAAIHNGWDEFKSGFEVVKDSVTDFFSSAPKNVGGAIGTGIGGMFSGLAESLLGGTFIAIKFVITVVIIIGIVWFAYRLIKKHCCIV